MIADIAGFTGQPNFGPERPGDQRRSALDIKLAADALGWKPWTHLEDGLDETGTPPTT